MSKRDDYPAGVPCWVDCLVSDVSAAMTFYKQLFQWEFVGSGPLPEEQLEEYFVARKDGRDVAGLAQLPADAEAGWMTQIAVDSVEETIERATEAGGDLLTGPIESPPAGRLAVLQDPTGAVFGIWEGASRKGAQTINEFNAWSMSTLMTPNVERARQFYSDVFGWQFDEWQGATLARLPGYVGGEPQQPVPRDVVAVLVPQENSGAAWNVEFWIDDAAKAAAQATENGGAVLVPPHPQGMFTTSILKDPGGAVFTVSQLH